MNYKTIMIEELTKVSNSWEAYEKERNRIDRQIARLQRKRDSLNPIGMHECLENIGKRISKKPNQVYGPFGLGAERSLYIMKGDDMNICGKDTVYKSITLRGSGLGARVVSYDEELSTEFEEGTIGYINGFNERTEPILDISDRRLKKIMSRT